MQQKLALLPPSKYSNIALPPPRYLDKVVAVS